MVYKFIAFAALVASANAGVLAPAPLAYHTAPVAYAATPVVKAFVAKTIDTNYDPHPQYSYNYNVHDSLTGDIKSQFEHRNEDVVQGSYSLVDPDGTRRTVDYTADPINGFNAVVRKEPLAVAVKTVATAPVYAKVATPVAYVGHAAPAIAKIAAPIAYTGYAAPTVKVAAPAYYH